jgi:hypothetical protein
MRSPIVNLRLLGNFSMVGTKPHDKAIMRLDRRPGAPGIVCHRNCAPKKFDQGLRPWTQEVKR